MTRSGEMAATDEMVSEEMQALLDEMEDLVCTSLSGAAAMIDRTPRRSLERQRLVQDLMGGTFVRCRLETALSLPVGLGG